MIIDTQTLTAIIAGIIAYYAIKTLKKSKYHVAPRISLKARILNILLTPLSYFQLSPVFKPLKLSSLEKQASNGCKGLADFGHPCYKVPYSQTMEMVNNGGYSPIGKAAAHDFFLRRLMAKLRLEDHLKSPSVSRCLKTPVNAPIFVVGLPRTGTTFLHRLLSLDPNSRAPKTYELFDPVPRYPSDPIKDKRRRVKFVQDAIDQLLMVVPHFKHIHEVGADLPEECMMSLGCDIPMLFATFHVLIKKPYTSFGWDSSQAYRNYARVLQLLQQQAEDGEDKELADKRWTLKCPVHLGLLKYLSSGFPDATIVWTHRDATQAVGSLCSFVRATQDMHEGGDIKLDELGGDVLNFAKEWIKRADDFLKANSRDKHPRCNVMYTELIKDPVGTVRKLYNEVGYEFTEVYKRRLEDYIKKNNEEREKLKKKGGKNLHSYNVREFGLEEEDIRKEFEWYEKKFFK